jgi:hypothetical protein
MLIKKSFQFEKIAFEKNVLPNKSFEKQITALSKMAKLTYDESS